VAQIVPHPTSKQIKIDAWHFLCVRSFDNDGNSLEHSSACERFHYSTETNDVKKLTAAKFTEFMLAAQVLSEFRNQFESTLTEATLVFEDCLIVHSSLMSFLLRRGCKLPTTITRSANERLFLAVCP